MGEYVLDYSDWILPDEHIVSSAVTQPGTPRLTVTKQEHEHLNRRIVVTATPHNFYTGTLRCSIKTDADRTHTFDLSVPPGQNSWWEMI